MVRKWPQDSWGIMKACASATGDISQVCIQDVEFHVHLGKMLKMWKRKNKWGWTARSAVDFAQGLKDLWAGWWPDPHKKCQLWFSFECLQWLMFTFLWQVTDCYHASIDSRLGRNVGYRFATTDNEVCLLPEVEARFYHRLSSHFPVTSHSGWKTPSYLFTVSWLITIYM